MNNFDIALVFLMNLIRWSVRIVRRRRKRLCIIGFFDIRERKEKMGDVFFLTFKEKIKSNRKQKDLKLLDRLDGLPRVTSYKSKDFEAARMVAIGVDTVGR